MASESNVYVSELSKISEEVEKLLARALEIEDKARKEKNEARSALNTMIADFESRDYTQREHMEYTTQLERLLTNRLTEKLEVLYAVQREACDLSDIIKSYYLRYAS